MPSRGGAVFRAKDAVFQLVEPFAARGAPAPFAVLLFQVAIEFDPIDVQIRFDCRPRFSDVLTYPRGLGGVCQDATQYPLLPERVPISTMNPKGSEAVIQGQKMIEEINQEPGSNFVVAKEDDLKGFLERYGLTGRIGITGGTEITHRFVRFGQFSVSADKRTSLWSHVVIFSREHGDLFIYESDASPVRDTLFFRTGAQKNPAEKYYSQKKWEYFAILDFHLTDDQTETVIGSCRRMIEGRIRYPVIGLVSTGIHYILGIADKRAQAEAPRSMFCSAFVQKAFQEAGVRFHPTIPFQHLGPEHIWQSRKDHTTYLRRKEMDELRRRGLV